MVHGLGRFVEHDPRSRDYPAMVAPVRRSVLWASHAPVLDQGQLGSCTGNAMAQCLNTDYFGRPHYLDETNAVDLYHWATELDGIPGTYPPQDTGSSGLGAAKAAQRLGYIPGYSHCFSFDNFCRAVQLQPVIVGTDWYDGMFHPTRAGYLRPTGSVAGGHEYTILGVDYEHQRVTMLNSWSASWGLGGRAYISFHDFAALLAAGGDVTAPHRTGVT